MSKKKFEGGDDDRLEKSFARVNLHAAACILSNSISVTKQRRKL